MSFKQALLDYKQLMKFMRPRRRLYYTGLIGDSLVNSGLSILIAFVIKDLLNFAVSGQLEDLYAAITIVIGSVVGLCILSPIFSYLYLRSIRLTLADMRMQLYKHIGKITFCAAEKYHSGDLLSRMTSDVQVVEKTYHEHLRSIVSQITMVAGSIIVLCVVDWRFALVLVVLALLTIGINARFSPRMRAIGDKLQAQMGILTERVGDLIGGLQITKLFGLRDQIGKLCEEASEEVSESGLKQGHQSGVLEACNFAVQFFSMGGILAIGLYLVSRQQLELGTLGLILYLQIGISSTFLQVGAAITLMQNSFAGAARIHQLLDQPAEPEGDRATAGLEAEPVCQEASGNVPALELCNVTFGYEPGRPVLRCLSMSATEGKVTAVVGPSGGGKSTIMKLLLSFYERESGVIHIQGKALEHYRIKELRELIAYVPQEAFLFHDSIAGNIRLGRPDASDEEVENAARMAQAHAFITELPDGYATMVGERGSTLSGGQRQRIAIARALLKNAPILLLDEATSALDAESEHEVQLALQELMRGRTTLIIAHRLSTIEQADCICVVADGSLVEQGTHEELLEKGGVYSKLHDLQYHAEQVLVSV
ncbi:ABC transporter ATP-binding protein [Paenibacillus elgii]